MQELRSVNAADFPVPAQVPCNVNTDVSELLGTAWDKKKALER